MRIRISSCNSSRSEERKGMCDLLNVSTHDEGNGSWMSLKLQAAIVVLLFFPLGIPRPTKKPAASMAARARVAQQ